MISRVFDFCACVGGTFCGAYLIREAAWGYVAFAAFVGVGLGIADLLKKVRHDGY